MANTKAKVLYGLDKELAQKEKEKFDPELAKQVQELLEELTGERLGNDMMESLKDGKIICQAVNAVFPGSIKISSSKVKYLQIENIGKFLKFCRSKLGIQEYDLFTTTDLFDGKSQVNVINGLVAFSRALGKNGYKGKVIGPTEQAPSAHPQKKHWKIGANGAVSKLNMGSSATMDKSYATKDALTLGTVSGTGSGGAVSKLNMGSSATMDKAYAPKDALTLGTASGAGSGGAVSKLNMGSSATMDKAYAPKDALALGTTSGTGVKGTVSKLNMGSSTTMDKASKYLDSLTLGTTSGVGNNSSVSKLNMGSTNMERREIHNSSDITFGASVSGTGANDAIPKLDVPTKMGRAHVDRSNDITFGADAGKTTESA